MRSTSPPLDRLVAGGIGTETGQRRCPCRTAGSRCNCYAEFVAKGECAKKHLPARGATHLVSSAALQRMLRYNSPRRCAAHAGLPFKTMCKQGDCAVLPDTVTPIDPCSAKHFSLPLESDSIDGPLVIVRHDDVHHTVIIPVLQEQLSSRARKI